MYIYVALGTCYNSIMETYVHIYALFSFINITIANIINEISIMNLFLLKVSGFKNEVIIRMLAQRDLGIKWPANSNY